MKLVIPKGAKLKGKIELADKKVRTKLCRFSYVHLHGEPKEFEGKRSWGLQCLFKKKDSIKELEIAAYNAAIEKWGPDISTWPKKKIKKNGKTILKNIVRMPFRDGDEEKPDNAEYEGMIFIGARKNEFNSKNEKQRPPQVCGPNPKDGLLAGDEIKSGDYGSVVLIAFAYEAGKNAGVSFALQMVQKQKNGKALGNGGSVENEFEEVEMDDDEDEEIDSESDDEEEEDEDSDDEDSEDEDEDDSDDEEDEDEDEEEDDEEEDEDEDEEEEKPKKSSKKSAKSSKSKKKSKR